MKNQFIKQLGLGTLIIIMFLFLLSICSCNNQLTNPIDKNNIVDSCHYKLSLYNFPKNQFINTYQINNNTYEFELLYIYFDSCKLIQYKDTIIQMKDFKVYKVEPIKSELFKTNIIQWQINDNKNIYAIGYLCGILEMKCKMGL